MAVQIFYNLLNHHTCTVPLRGKVGQRIKRKRVLCWSILCQRIYNYIYLQNGKHPPPTVVLNWDAFLSSVCCILHYLSVCITAARAGGERRVNLWRQGGAVRSVRIYILWLHHAARISWTTKWDKANNYTRRDFNMGGLRLSLKCSEIFSIRSVVDI